MCAVNQASQSGGPSRIAQVSFFLPYPDNKWPVLKAYLDSLGGYYTAKRIVGSAKGYPRPVMQVIMKAGAAIGFMRSIGWECGKPKKDAAMRVWRRWAERPRLIGAYSL